MRPELEEYSDDEETMHAVPVSTGAVRHLLEHQVRNQINARYLENPLEINDACAATIASWYQSPRTADGMVFATLASGLPVNYGDLCTAIMHELSDAQQADEDRGESGIDEAALLALLSWATNGPDEVQPPVIDDDDDEDVESAEVETLTEAEAEDRYDEWLNEVYGTVNIAAYEYETSRALREVDPIAYRVGLSDWLDSEGIDLA